MADDTQSTKSGKSTKSAKSKKGDEEEEEEEDPRLEFMFNYMMRSLRIKPDKWAKLLLSKEFGVSSNCLSDIKKQFENDLEVHLKGPGPNSD